MEAKFFYQTESEKKEGVFSLQDYQEAANWNLTPSQYLNAKYSDADQDRFGTAFDQGMQSLGIRTKADPSKGIRVSTVGEILSGRTLPTGLQAANGSTLVSPGTQGTTPATRIFFPEVVMTLMNSALTEDYSPEMAAWDRMISATEFIPSEMFTQPLIDVSAPRAERSQRISQNALPRSMVSITSSQTSKSITTESIGLQISEQAQRTSAIDLVVTILAQQAQGERFARMWDDISAVIAGNVDAGQAALSATDLAGYDSAATGDVMTQKAWLYSLNDPTRKVSYDSMICNLQTVLDLQARTGRPLIFDPRISGDGSVAANVGNAGNYGLNVEPNVLNFGIAIPNLLIVPDGTITASNYLLFDSRYGLRRVINTFASYSAVETMVLQRTDVFRFDFGELVYRLLDEAFKLCDYS